MSRWVPSALAPPSRARAPRSRPLTACQRAAAVPPRPYRGGVRCRAPSLATLAGGTAVARWQAVRGLPRASQSVPASHCTTNKMADTLMSAILLHSVTTSSFNLYPRALHIFRNASMLMLPLVAPFTTV